MTKKESELMTKISMIEDTLFQLKSKVAETYHRDSGGVVNPLLYGEIMGLEDRLIELRKELNKVE